MLLSGEHSHRLEAEELRPTMSANNKKLSSEAARKRIRALGATPWEVTQCVMAIAANSGKELTFLIPEETSDDEDDDYPDDLQERVIGWALDNCILGFLPIDASCKITPDASLPAEVMTVGGTPIKVDRVGQSIVLVDPLGTRSTVTGYLCRGPNILGCKVDLALMTNEWFSDEPSTTKHGSRRINRCEMLQPSSAMEALGDWQSFNLPTAQSGVLKVRTRLGNEAVLAKAREQAIVRVRCILSPDQVDNDGGPRQMRQLNKVEDFLAIGLMVSRSRAIALAVVSRPASYDFYYCTEDVIGLQNAVQRLPRHPFDIKITRIIGDTSKLLGSLTLPRPATKGI